jgi:hypothetical protein
MRTFITIVALLAVVTASLVLMSGEDAVVSTYVPVVDGDRSDVGRQDARKLPAASPRTSSEREPSLSPVAPDRAALIGLMMMLGGHPGR